MEVHTSRMTDQCSCIRKLMTARRYNSGEGLTFVQVCRMPSADYEPKHECMGTKIGRHRPITTL